MNKSGKIWGETRLLISNSSVELHHIKFKRKFECSLHKHNTKFNAFYVLSGTMNVVVKKSDYDLEDITPLKAGELHIVPPGEYHKFVGVEDGEALELYWSEFDPRDIVRKGVGGPSDSIPDKKARRKMKAQK